jgi:hypothetical protein
MIASNTMKPLRVKTERNVESGSSISTKYINKSTILGDVSILGYPILSVLLIGENDDKLSIFRVPNFGTYHKCIECGSLKLPADPTRARGRNLPGVASLQRWLCLVQMEHTSLSVIVKCCQIGE